MEINSQTNVTGQPALSEAVEAAKAGNMLLARLALENADHSHHDHVDFWLWQAWASDSPASAILALQRVLSKDPDHQLALHGMAWAEGLKAYRVTETAELPRSEETAESLAECEPILESDFSHGQMNESSGDDASEGGVFEDDIARDVESTQQELDEFLGEASPLEESSDTEDFPVFPAQTDQTYCDPPAPSEDTEDESCTASDLIGDDSGENDDTSQLAGDEESPSTAPLVEPRGSTTVLAVDDSPTIRKLLSMSLAKHGYDVVTACDGMDALNHISSCNPALVLLDINMPRLDGYQLCKLIKNHEKTRMIPVVMLSGKDGIFDKIRGKLVGCDDYITKPFETSELLKKVSAYVAAPVVEES